MSKIIKRFGWPLLGALIASLIFLTLAQSSLMAQAKLVKSTPADNQIFKTSEAPDRVTLTFSENLKADASTLRVIDALGNPMDDGKVTVNGADISIGIVKRKPADKPNDPISVPAADYSVQYDVISDADGSNTAGSYNFKVVPVPGNPLDAGYLLTTPTSAFGDNWNIYFPWALIGFVVFIIGAIIANFFYFYAKYRFRNNRLTYTIVNRASRNAAIAFSLGVFFYLCRIGNLQPFNARLWLYLASLLLVYYIIRGVIWRARVYPKAKAEWLEILQRQRRKAPEVAPVAPAKAVPAATTLSSADAGGEDRVKSPATPDGARPGGVETPRGLSQRGQKRREKKRDRR
jgi:methionine-rich copper-binding protein CopC